MKSQLAALAVATAVLVPSLAHADDSSRQGSVGAAFELLPTGTIKANFAGGATSSADADTGYAVAIFAESQIDELISVGLAPRYIFNVNTANSTGDSATELDLRARVTIGHEVASKLRAYGFGEPGWAIIFLPSSVQINNDHVHPNGFVLGVGGGLSYALASRTRAFFELGYQWGFQSWSASGTVLGQTVTVSGDDKTNYLQLGFGLSIAMD